MHPAGPHSVSKRRKAMGRPACVWERACQCVHVYAWARHLSGLHLSELENGGQLSSSIVELAEFRGAGLAGLGRLGTPLSLSSASVSCGSPSVLVDVAAEDRRGQSALAWAVSSDVRREVAGVVARQVLPQLLSRARGTTFDKWNGAEASASHTKVQVMSPLGGDVFDGVSMPTSMPVVGVVA